MHADRKNSLVKLYSILEKSSNYAELVKNMDPFVETLDFELLPDNVISAIRERIGSLKARESEAPWNPPISMEGLESQIQAYEEARAEEYEAMTVEERFTVELNGLAVSAKAEINRAIKAYFEEPSEE